MKLNLCRRLLTAAVVTVGSVVAIISRAQSGPPAPPPPPLLEFLAFNDDTNWLAGFGYAPLSYTNISAVDSWEGTMLHLNSSNAAYLRYNLVESDSHTNLICSEGSIRFWFSPDWASTNQGGTGPGTSGRFVEVGNYTSDNSYGWWSLYLNPEGTAIYFSGQTNGAGATYLSAPISWISNSWHHVGLSYTATNSVLYIDDHVATNGSGVAYWPADSVRSNGFYIGSDNTGLAQARGRFESFRTYVTVWGDSFFTNSYNVVYPRIQDWLGQSGGQNAASLIDGGEYSCATGGQVYLTNTSCAYVAGQGWTFSFGIAGGTSGLLYDVFSTTNLLGNNITNSDWVALGQGQTCNMYSVTNQPDTNAFYVLGGPQDTDADGLTDAYEVLVSKTNPYSWDSDGDGIPDGWEVAHGLNPRSYDSNLDPDGDGLTNLQEYFGGTDPQVQDNYGIFLTEPKPGSILP